MGLDTVELVLEVEDEFGIALEDAEAETAVTVGRLYDLVLDKLAVARSGGCGTMRAFHGLRRALREVRGVARRDVRPSASMAAVFPEVTRRRDWRRLGSELGWRLPALRRPDWLRRGVVLATLAIVLGAAILVAFEFLPLGAGIVLGVVGIAAVHWATRPAAVLLPPSCSTVGDAAQWIAVVNVGPVAAEPGKWDDGRVWERLLDVVTEQCGAKRDQLDRDTRFIVDLGLD